MWWRTKASAPLGRSETCLRDLAFWSSGRAARLFGGGLAWSGHGYPLQIGPLLSQTIWKAMGVPVGAPFVPVGAVLAD